MKTEISGDLKLIAEKLGIDLHDLSKQPLEGLWEGVQITERDIEQAKKAVFPKRDIA